MERDDLLSPSLSKTPIEPIYSVGALIAAAFLGGGIGVTALAFANSLRLSRLDRDGLWLLLALSASIALAIATGVATTDLDAASRPASARLYLRALGFALCGGFFLLHREAYRTMQVAGRAPPSPYVAVIVAVAVSLFFHAIAGMLIEATTLLENG